MSLFSPHIFESVFLAVFFFFSVCAGVTSKHSIVLEAQRERFPRKSFECVGVHMRDRESNFREEMEMWCLDLCLHDVNLDKKKYIYTIAIVTLLI